MLSLLSQVMMLKTQHLRDPVLDVRQAGQQGTAGQPTFGAGASGGLLPAHCPPFSTSHIYLLCMRATMRCAFVLGLLFSGLLALVANPCMQQRAACIFSRLCALSIMRASGQRA